MTHVGSHGHSWGNNGIAICTESGNQNGGARMVLDGNDGAVLVWRDRRPKNGKGRDGIYAQRVNALGKILWTKNGESVCDTQVDDGKDYVGGNSWFWAPVVVSDSEHGAIVAWEEQRGNQTRDVYIQRIDYSGKLLWQQDGLIVCNANSEQKNTRIVSDGQGGAIVCWTDYRNGNYDIYAQHINSKGNILWQSNGVPICTSAYDQYWPEMVSDNQGGAIIVWDDARSYYQRDVYAQRINGKGKVLWQKNGIPVCTETNDQWYPKMISDGKGGAIINWSDFRNGLDYDLIAQWIDKNGQARWQHNGLAICTEKGNQTSSSMSFDGYGGLIFAYLDMRNNAQYDIFAQKVEISSIKSLTPLGGESFIGGQEDTITWQSSGVDYLKIEYSLDSGNEWKVVTASTDAGKGRYAWTVPNQDTKKALIRISDAELSNVNNQNVQPFSITAVAEENNKKQIVSATTWYFAEGSTKRNFITWFLIQNPNDIVAQVTVVLYSNLGEVIEVALEIPANSRCTLNAKDIAGFSERSDFAAKIECSNGLNIISERVMYETLDQTNKGLGHCSLGTTKLGNVWCFAEGSTDGYYTWFLFFNPSDTKAEVAVDLMRDDGVIVTDRIEIPPKSRYSYLANDRLPNAHFGAKIVSLNEVPLAVERTLYWGDSFEAWQGGHSNFGCLELSKTWYYAEGTTADFIQWFTLMNISDGPVPVIFDFMDTTGRIGGDEIIVPAHSRYTYKVNDLIDNVGFATKITAAAEIVSERSMYWGNRGGHCSSGSVLPKSTWYFAEGATGDNYTEWLLLQNPNDRSVTCRFSFIGSLGFLGTSEVTISANSRGTYLVNEVVSGNIVALKVECLEGLDIVADRSMYWDGENEHWIDGHSSKGFGI